MHRTITQWISDTVLFITLGFIACIYFVLNAPSSTVYYLNNAIDDLIPRIPFFVIPYLLFIPWLWLTVLYVWYKGRYFRQLALSLIIVNLIAYFVYTFFLTAVPRTEIVGNDIFTNILRIVYGTDNIYCGFPSLHSALSASIATYFLIKRSRFTYFFVFMAGLIVVSTLLTKQHFIVDAISGIVLGSVVTAVIFWIFPEQIYPKPNNEQLE